MLVIRMQRTGRKGHAQFRVVVQDSRRTPTSGKIVAAIGSFNPHAKTATLDKEKAEFYLKNGAQPSPRVARLLKAEGVKLPDWVEIDSGKKREIRNVEKLRRNRPAGAEAPAEAEETAADVSAPADNAEAPKEETPAEEVAAEEAPTEAPAEETAEAAPAEEEKTA